MIWLEYSSITSIITIVLIVSVQSRDTGESMEDEDHGGRLSMEVGHL